MRALWTGALIAVCASQAMASFELLLVSDSGSDTIRRFDPVSGAAFGSFGGGFLVDPVGVAVNTVLGEAVVADAGGRRITYWNYNTGEYLRTSIVPSGVTYLNQNPDGTVNLAYSNRVVRYGWGFGSPIATYAGASGLTVQQGMLQADGRLYVSHRDSVNVAYRWHDAPTGALIGTTNWVADRTVAIGSHSVNVYASTTSVAFEVDIHGNGPFFQFASFLSGYDAVAGVAAGHGSAAYAAVRSTGGTWEVRRYDALANVVMPGFAVGQLTTPTGMAIVVAPEPASLVALGLGALALMRRRRNRA